MVVDGSDTLGRRDSTSTLPGPVSLEHGISGKQFRAMVFAAEVRFLDEKVVHKQLPPYVDIDHVGWMEVRRIRSGFVGERNVARRPYCRQIPL
jgi:hypothetical protein